MSNTLWWSYKFLRRRLRDTLEMVEICVFSVQKVLRLILIYNRRLKIRISIVSEESKAIMRKFEDDLIEFENQRTYEQQRILRDYHSALDEIFYKHIKESKQKITKRDI